MQNLSTTLNAQCAALESMGITQWVRPNIAENILSKLKAASVVIQSDLPVQSTPTKSEFKLNFVYSPKQPKYLVVLGMEGVWANTNQQQERREMFKKLLQAIQWQWSECFVVEFIGKPNPLALAETVTKLNLEKAVIFGKELSAFINTQSMPIAFLPNFDQLLQNVSYKREAWETLKKFVV